jgi:hypothetical protein
MRWFCLKFCILVRLSVHGYLKLNELSRIQSCLQKAYKWGFTTVKYDISELFDLADYNLFKSVSDNAGHCIYSLLPSKRDSRGRQLRSRGHKFQLPYIKTSLLKDSFVNRCLFKFVHMESNLLK